MTANVQQQEQIAIWGKALDSLGDYYKDVGKTKGKKVSDVGIMIVKNQYDQMTDARVCEKRNWIGQVIDNVVVFITKGINLFLPKNKQLEVHEKFYDAEQGLQFLRLGRINILFNQTIYLPKGPENLKEQKGSYNKLVDDLADQKFGKGQTEEKAQWIKLYKWE